MNTLNQLTNITRSGTMTVAGTTTSAATNVTVNTSNAVLYLDYTFASTNHSLADGTNTFTAIGKDNLGRVDTNTATVYLPASPNSFYDSSGNLTYDGQKSLEYDDENQLTKITATNLWKSEFTYDGKMRRRIRREYTWQNSSWVLTNEVRYIYDGNLVLQERNTWNLPAITYTRGNDLSGTLEGAGGIGGLLARTDHSIFVLNPSAAHAYYFADGNGNVTCMINTNQQVVARYLYDPFGRIVSISGPLAEANLFRFSSKEFHEASGLIYYLYRYYDPNLHRWPNADPVEEIAFQNQTRTHRSANHFKGNLYWFAENAPLSNIDSWGLITFDGCSPDDQQKMTAAIKNNCDKAMRCAPKCPNGGMAGVGGLCSSIKSKSITIHCRPRGWVGPDGSKCKCGLTAVGSNDLNICQDAFDPKICEGLECTLFHEALHGPGEKKKHDQEFADFDKCMGCTPEPIQK